jgi:hypothetical protein
MTRFQLLMAKRQPECHICEFLLVHLISQPVVCIRIAVVFLLLLSPITGYSFADTQDTSLGNFNINAAPSYLFGTIADIQAINPYLKVHVLPWSPVSSILPTGHTTDNFTAGLDERFGFFEWRKSSQYLRNHMFV